MLNKKYIPILLLVISLLALPLLSQAGFIPTVCLEGTGEKCGMRELLQTFANFYAFLLKYLGAVALLFFVVGGVIMINSGGNQERVTRGRHILIGTTIGLLIVMGSYVFIKRIQNLIGVNESYQITADSDNFCVSKDDGEQCGDNYICQLGLCQDGSNGRDTITQCEFTQSGTCIDGCNTTTCPNGTCETGFCPGAASITCCVPSTNP